MDTFTNYSTSDHNGFRPDPEAQASFVWTSPPFETVKNYTEDRVQRTFSTLDDYRRATHQDQNSITLDYDVFMGLGPADSKHPSRLYAFDELDFRLRPDSPAADAGCILHNINDGYTGNAPALGALEIGCPAPIYGPRPISDENASRGNRSTPGDI
jgi:hypothetical protein